MTEKVHISSDGTHLLVTSAGPPSLEEMEQTLSRLVELRLQHGIDRVLVDSRARNEQPSVADIYRGGELISKILRGSRIAVLVTQIEDDHTLFGDVAFNRGLNIAFFQDEQLALSWLLQLSQDSS